MNNLQKQLYRTLYKKSFYDFVKDFWQYADPSKFIDGSLIQFYCEVFQYKCKPWIGYEEIEIDVPKMTDEIDVIDIRTNKSRLNINMPPRHSKSKIFNVLAGAWIETILPIKLASISHTGGLATKMNTERKNIINSERYTELWPEISLIINKTDQLVDNRGGELYSLNRDAMTGYGADIIVNDDLTNAQTARKDKEEMANAWAYYQNTMPSRINDLEHSLVINIQQRLAPNDITGHILEDAKLAGEYDFIVLPAIFDKETYLVCPISGRIIHFNKGDPLWPERFGDYSTLRNEVGESVFQTQYLQKPMNSDKSVIKEEWIIEKDPVDVNGYDISNRRIDMLSVDNVYISHDFPVKDKEKSDNLGSVLGYMINSTLYMVDALEKKMAFVDSTNYARALDTAYPGSVQIIEDKANGSAILQQLQEFIAGLQSFQPGTDSKTQRLESSSIYLKSGNVVFVKTVFNKMTNSWELSEGLLNLKKKLLKFPFLDHDDVVDAFSQLVLFAFMDKIYMVYGRSFNDLNVIKEIPFTDYTTVFFNKEGDIWKATEIAVQYSSSSKMYVIKELQFKASASDGLEKLHEVWPNKTMFIDCSISESLSGVYKNKVVVERYEIEDFDISVGQLNLAFASNRVFVKAECKSTIRDINSFKYDKSKDTNIKKYRTNRDGFVACLRMGVKYYSIY